MVIKINVTNKRAVLVGSPVIVCGNSGYTLEFTFDAEWSAESVRTARFVYVRDGSVQYQDVVFSGTTAQVPILANIKEVRVGVFAGDLHTSTPALIPCEKSIRCGTGAPEDPTPSQYDQIMALLSEDVVPHAAQHRAGGSDPLTAADVGARPNTWMPTAADVGARPDTWTPTAADVGAVNKAGDTMTGNLTIKKSNSVTATIYPDGSGVMVQTYSDWNKRKFLHIPSDEAAVGYDRLQYVDIEVMGTGANGRFDIFHTGNKPSGSYTGNGEATARTVDIGGIGNVLFIRAQHSVIGFACFYGGVMFNLANNTTQYYTRTRFSFADGVLTIATSDAHVNNNGTEFYYQVL